MYRRHMPTRARSIVLTQHSEEAQLTRALLTRILSSRELTLATILAGEKDFRINCQRLFAGLRVTDDMIDSMWRFVECRKGPNPKYEYDQVQQRRQEQENRERQETLFLKDLYERARGKGREEDEARIARQSPAPESVRLPEIAKA